jgi:hypothetical protein
MAQPERENYSGITSAVCLEVLSRGPSIDGFSFNGWNMTIESSFRCSAGSASRRKTFTHASRRSSETPIAASGGSSMFDKDPKNLHDEVRSGRPPMDFLDIRILTLLDEQPFHSDYSIAEALGVSHSTILGHLNESLGM